MGVDSHFISLLRDKVKREGGVLEVVMAVVERHGVAGAGGLRFKVC